MAPRALAGRYAWVVLAGLVILGLYFTSSHSYLLFHSLAEVFSIIVAVGIFALAWNARRNLDNNYFLLIGIAYLFVGGLDLLHMLAYPGMGVFAGQGTNLAAQLWLCARYFEGLSLLIAPLVIGRRMNVGLFFVGYVLVASLLLVSLFYWNVFPDAFVEGTGLTPFKKISEYVISFTLFAAIYLLLRKRDQFDRNVLRLLVLSITLTIGSELAFTSYVDPYGVPNLIGHVLKVISFYLIYRAIIVTGLVKPYDLLFRNLKRSEEAARESWEYYAALMGNIADAVFTIKEGRISWCNDTAERMYGLRRDELIGREAGFFYPQNLSASEFTKTVSQTLGREGVFRSTASFQRRDGTEIEIEYSISRVLGKEPTELVAVARDITERKQAEMELWDREQRLRTLVDTMAEGVVVVDLDGRIVQANPAAEHLLGLKRSDIEGRLYVGPEWQVLRPDGTPMPPEEMAGPLAVREKGPVRDVVMGVMRPDGSVCWLNVNAQPLRNEAGAITGVVGTFTDITERMKLDQLKDEFIGMVSHELRSPLTVVMGAVSTALSEAERLSPEELRQLLQDAASEAENLSHLVGNLLELSRFQAKRFILYVEPIDTKKVVRDLVDRMGGQHPAYKFITALPRNLPAVPADQLRLERILHNLIENAVKYSAEGSEIRVFARREREDIVFGVSDKGIGISAEDQAKLFEPFTRVGDSSADGSKGVGLGLLVCRRLVEAHRGRIWVESEPGKGSTFLFTLP